MPIVVEVMEEHAFDVWYQEQLEHQKVVDELSRQTMTTEQLMAEGEAVYDKNCASCHQSNGLGIPPAFPSLVGTAVVTGDRLDHLRLVNNGVPGSAMQEFGKQLTPREIAAVVHYERHAWGNNAGDITQPVDVVNLGQ